MPNYRITLPAIKWGAAFANTLNIGYWLDNVVAGDEPRAGSVQMQGPSGVEDAWTIGTDYTLAFDVRWITQTGTATPLASGWDGATGFRAFLAWARDKNLLRFIPDVTAPGTFIDSYLVDPMTGVPASETDGTRTLKAMKIRNYTSAYDGY